MGSGSHVTQIVGRRAVVLSRPGAAGSPRRKWFSADLALSRLVGARDLAIEAGVLEAPQEDTGRLTVDNSHPSPGKLVLSINEVIVTAGRTYASLGGLWCQSLACDKRAWSTW